MDLRYSIRLLMKTPGFTASAVLLLALGIGANTTVFSVINGILFRPAPGLESPGRLVEVGWARGPSYNPLSWLEYTEIRDRARSFSGVAAFRSSTFILGTGDGAERVQGEIVSPNYFAVLGVRPALGRAFPNEEDRTRAVAVISHALWRRSFRGDPGILGATLKIRGYPFTVIGVAPEGFRGVRRGNAAEIWLPAHALEQAQFFQSRFWRMLLAIARLRPGVTLAQARAEMDSLAALIERENAGAYKRGYRIALNPGFGLYGVDLRSAQGLMTMLAGAVALILLIACANLANLLLARAAARRREIDVRLALGSGRARLVRQMLTESALLALAGGACGLLVALWGASALLPLEPRASFDYAFDLRPDLRVLGFTLALSVLTAMLFGLVPALQATRPNLVPALKSSGGAGRGRTRLRDGLVAAQVAISLALLAAAGLLLKSLRNSLAVDPGFRPERVWSMSLDVSAVPKADEFSARLVREVGNIAGLEASALGDAPLAGWGTTMILPEGETVPFGVGVRTVSPGYFRTLGIPLLAGRDFASGDTAASPKVVVVNRALARRFRQDVGRRLTILRQPANAAWQIIGVAADVREVSLLKEAEPTVYLPYTQDVYQPGTLLFRAVGDPRAAILAAVRRAGSDVAVYNARPLGDFIGRSLWQQRAAATLAGIFSLLGMILAAAGLYAMMAYSVAQRTREIGVRMAIGASAASVFRLVLRQAASLLAIGLAAGIALALAATRLLAGRLYGLGPRDPQVLAAAALVLLSAGIASAWLPARRATRVDPITALREDG